MDDKITAPKAQPFSETVQEDLRDAHAQKDLALRAFMGRGQSRIGMDAQKYIRSLRENDRI